MNTTIRDHITNAETALDAAIKAAVEGGNIELAERIRNAAFHVANILGVQITTTTEALNQFTEAELNTLLCDMPDSEFELGARFNSICREAGDSSGRAAANNLGLWRTTLREASEIVTAPTCGEE